MSQNHRSSLFESTKKQIIQFGSRPNMKNYNVTEISSLVNNAKTVLVAIPQTTIDSVGAGLALAIALKKQGKEVKVYCPNKTDNNYSKLAGLEMLSDVISSGDLVVSLNYPLDQIDAVSYNDDGGRLNLVVKTKSGSPKIEDHNIEINNQSASADVCFMLGDETSLGANAAIVTKGNWVFISPIQVNKAWAKATLVDPDAPFSEIFTFLLPQLGLELDMDSGKDLLIGLRVATESFSINVSPESFEAGAACLRATQPPEDAPVANGMASMPIEAVEKTGGIAPGTNKPNPNPMV